MKITIIDLLSDAKIFKSSAETKTIYDCKFVLLSSNDEIVLLFGPLRSYNYHAKLVEYFCLQKNIPSSWEHRPDLYELHDSTYRINGGGWFRFDFEKNRLIINGASTAYGIYHKDILAQALSSAQFVDQLDVHII